MVGIEGQQFTGAGAVGPTIALQPIEEAVAMQPEIEGMARIRKIGSAILDGVTAAMPFGITLAEKAGRTQGRTGDFIQTAQGMGTSPGDQDSWW